MRDIINLTLKTLSILSKFLDYENERLDLWYVASYLFGILVFFSMDSDPSLPNIYIFIFTIIFCIITIIFIKSSSTKFLSKIILCGLLGFLISYNRTSSIDNSTLEKPIENIEISGLVTRLKPTPYGSQITISKVKNPSNIKLPNNIRINVSKYDTKLILIGDTISMKCSLFPVPEQVVPGGYNFKQIAFFNQIGAIGSAKSEPEILSYKNTFEDYTSLISNIRKKLYNILLDNLGYKNGNFAAAIFLGEIGGIDKTTLNNMRFAGISHILCVSGLHLSIVASIFFLSFRVIFNLSDWVSYNFDIKKLAGYMSLIFSFIYLMLTGMQIAATRAFIMTSVMILSIILNKQPYPIRSLSLACIIILTLNPEYAIHPSFQLSFIAVLSLLVGYEFYTKSKNFFGNSKSGVLSNFKLYLFSNLYSSLVASLATAPIVMYHFYVYSNYSLLANLVAVPLVSFIIMPIGIAAIIISFLPISSPLFWIINHSISLMKYSAAFVVSLPHSVLYTGFVSNFAIMLFLLSFFWICFWKGKIRYLGIFGLVFFTINLYLTKKPIILINKESNYVACYQNNEVKIYSKKISGFTKNIVANWFGNKSATFFKQKNMDKICLSGNQDSCIFTVDFLDNKISYLGTTYNINNMSIIYIENDKLYIQDFSKKRKMFDSNQ